jgi:hypothetical protein
VSDRYIEVRPIHKLIDDEPTRNEIHAMNLDWLKLHGYTDVTGELLYDFFDEQWISRVEGNPPVMSSHNE